MTFDPEKLPPEERVRHYRAVSDEAAKMAEAAASPDTRVQLQHLALGWRALAAQVEKDSNSGIVPPGLPDNATLHFRRRDAN